jgi:ribosomal protein L16 Arg81 hydroxylase
MELCRALEILFENPASPGIFWSAAGANAPVHHDEVDLIIIQLTGKKRWFISADAPTLPNTWKVAGEGAPPLERHHVIDVVPGDVLYLPRGTSHTVESTTESIHVSIGFLPVTVREAVSALADYFSESERAVRAGVAKRADDLANGKRDNDIAATLRASLKALLERCQSDEFIHAALERRRARMIEDLPKITPAAGEAQVRPESRVRHHPLAVAHVLAVGDSVDFRQPGERILVHRGAEEALRFIVQTPEFRVSEIPGPLGDEVKVALVSRLLTSGFLQML